MVVGCLPPQNPASLITSRVPANVSTRPQERPKTARPHVGQNRAVPWNEWGRRHEGESQERVMNQSQIVSFLWGVADLIRDTFRRGRYQ